MIWDAQDQINGSGSMLSFAARVRLETASDLLTLVDRLAVRQEVPEKSRFGDVIKLKRAQERRSCSTSGVTDTGISAST
jgi:hypothetical protein